MAEFSEPHVSSDMDRVSTKVEVIDDMLSLIFDNFATNSISFTSSEELSMTKLRAQLEKLGKNSLKGSSSAEKPEDDLFTESFLASFTTSAFVSELDTLRTSEEFTLDDLSTLAATIRSFAADMSPEDRALYLESLSSTS